MLEGWSAFKIDRDKYYTVHFGTASPSFRKKFKLWRNQYGFHCVFIYRMVQSARNLKSKIKILAYPYLILALLANYFMRFFHHVDISNAQIGPGLYIGHVGTIIIGPSEIGSNLSLGHNVTIGVGHSKGKEGIPVIGDNVWIGAGSIIAGAISIGHNVTISAGTVLSKTIPENSLVGGNPGRIIMRDYDNAKLLGVETDE
ncbi:MAG: DapH/DapD/GlmU-related protein [Candidatus Zixiibacteriota bacterium]